MPTSGGEGFIGLIHTEFSFKDKVAVKITFRKARHFLMEKVRVTVDGLCKYNTLIWSYRVIANMTQPYQQYSMILHRL